MNAKTLKALKGSIEKWDKIVKGTGVDGGTDNCPLCHLQFGCRACPVYEKTKKGSCLNTPYESWEDHLHEEHKGIESKIHCPTCKTLAIKELNFLKNLLPKRRKRNAKS